MSQLSSTMVCRPSSSGTVLVVASYHMDIARPSYAEEVEPPSDYEVCRLVQQRVRMHFNNRGKIELDRFVLHYLVYVDEPCPLIYVCIAEPARSFDSAQEYLSTFQGALLNQAQLLMLLPLSGERELQPHIEPILISLMMAENSHQSVQDKRISEMKKQVNEVKTVMVANVEAIMDRGDRLDSIQRRTDELQASSANFKLTAHRVQRKMCILNAKWTIITVISAVLGITVVVLIILDACGVFDKK